MSGSSSSTAAARTGSHCGATGRVAVQVLALAAILGAALLAVILDSVEAASVAAIAAAALALVGVAIDVLDAVGEERESPTESIRRRQFMV
jgi:hypothetical protein